ncbi:hypothetical protein GCM10022408_00680 [Hymenobacter fastidiosus]|uniref:DUF4274 domain-containing protein n=1 Tax=Hymenobacter fastidiosus TaxID=486264 RepID=A0ABP7R8X5_9BACT
MRLIGVKRTRFIVDNFFEQSFQGKEPGKSQFDKLNSSTELHYLASIYNWDDGTALLEWVVNHSKCDRATALMIFWRSEPDFYTRFNSESEADFEADVFRLVRLIVSNFEANKYKKASLEYNPAKEGYDVDYVDPKEKWSIPNNLKISVKGSQVYSVVDIMNSLKSWLKALQNRRRRQKRRKR